VPRRNDWLTEKQAMAIVRAEEVAKGWTPGPTLTPRMQRVEGCDFLSQPPGGEHVHPIEVKGWSEPLLVAVDDDAFKDLAEVNAEQLERARSDPNWRLEIVANLRAARAGTGAPQRLTLSGTEVVERTRPWKYRVDLSGLASRIRDGKAVEGVKPTAPN
jgi:hypothetical protein